MLWGSRPSTRVLGAGFGCLYLLPCGWGSCRAMWRGKMGQEEAHCDLEAQMGLVQARGQGHSLRLDRGLQLPIF